MMKLSLLLCALLAGPADAQCVELATLQASDAQSVDNAGCAVALDGARALMGARNEAPGGVAGAGSVYVYELQVGAWVETAKLVASDASSGAQFGCAVALEGERALVGAYKGAHGGVPNVGSAYVFELQGGVWVETDVLSAPVPTISAGFGTSVALSGDRLLVGSPQADQGAELAAGGAFVFELQGGAWVQVDELVWSGASTLDLFGHAVALEGERAVVGAYGEDLLPMLGIGAVYVFELTAGVWVETAALFASDPTAYARLGFSVALDGDLLLAGAPHRSAGGLDKVGGGYVFELDETGWVETAILEQAAPVDGEQLGWSLALDLPNAVLASPVADGGSGLTAAGTARVFREQGGSWSAVGTLEPSAPQTLDYLGWSAALQGSTALIGVITGDVPGVVNAGKALVFPLPPCDLLTYCACSQNAPCGNTDPSAGCANSTGSGAPIAVLAGGPSVGADDLVLGASNTLPNQPGLFFQGLDVINNGLGIPLGDGLRCAGNGVIRLQVAVPNPAGDAMTTVSVATVGAVTAGDVRRYQFWYRDPQGSPCGNGFNLTNALELLWTP